MHAIDPKINQNESNQTAGRGNAILALEKRRRKYWC
jgi:hypothetical protein